MYRKKFQTLEFWLVGFDLSSEMQSLEFSVYMMDLKYLLVSSLVSIKSGDLILLKAIKFSRQIILYPSILIYMD